MKQSENKGRFFRGWIPIPDTKWKVETIENGEFVYLGEILVSGKLVSEEMNTHKSIKGYEAYDIAEKLASEKFAKRLKIKGKHLLKPIIVSQIYEEEK